MKLSTILKALNIAYDGEDMQIDFITDDSRNCRNASIFVCHDAGTQFLSDALKNGAAVIVASSRLCENCIVVDDTRRAYALFCREYFSRPDEKLKMIAVTGTNGKTSVSTMLHFMLEMNGKKTGLVGTVVNKFGKEAMSSMTTPDCFDLYSMLSDMVKSGFEYCVIEASSQGLAQQRLYGISFECAVFTNLTEDHLDYHKTFENYKKAKLLLFESCKTAIINFDDPYKDEFISSCKGKTVTYSTESDEADFTVKNIRYVSSGSSYELVSDSLIHRITLNMQGDFWIANSAAAVICALSCSLTLENCAYAIKKFSGVKGRMEILETNTDFRVIIDYAHTADGLKRVLMSLRRFCVGRIILVFGCGGDREKEKRPIMGKEAINAADIVFVTSDNPRTEDPQSIIDDILCGMKKTRKPVYIQADRTKAIEKALETARKDDIVLLAGKGHEEYQVKGQEKIPYNEREIVSMLLKRKNIL